VDFRYDLLRAVDTYNIPLIRLYEGSVINESKQRAMGKGDFTRIAESMRERGQALVKGFGITKELKVLDLGCGDGTTAIPEARLGADVLGVDMAKNLVGAGNRRAKQEGLTNCRFQGRRCVQSARAERS
jgi:2-polyprenyl-3-methyl-5-hydroxy-6-metoxy-1,4-benzoquinol methylase